MKIMREDELFPGKIYTPGTNFARPLVLTVATSLKSGKGMINYYYEHSLCAFEQGIFCVHLSKTKPIGNQIVIFLHQLLIGYWQLPTY